MIDIKSYKVRVTEYISKTYIGVVHAKTQEEALKIIKESVNEFNSCNRLDHERTKLNDRKYKVIEEIHMRSYL